MSPTISTPVSTGATLVAAILLIIGQLSVIATLILGIIGIIFLAQASSEKIDINKKKKRKKGIIFCAIGPIMIVLIIILYFISQWLLH